MPESYEADVFVPQPVEPLPSAASLQNRRESLKEPHAQRMTPDTVAPGGTAAPATVRGAVFELPLLISFLTMVGIVDHRKLIIIDGCQQVILVGLMKSPLREVGYLPRRFGS